MWDRPFRGTMPSTVVTRGPEGLKPPPPPAPSYAYLASLAFLSSCDKVSMRGGPSVAFISIVVHKLVRVSE